MNTLRCGYRPLFPHFYDEVMERVAEPEKELVFKPAANVREDDKFFAVELSLPGFEKEEISMKLEKDILTISAGRPSKEQEVKYTYNEFGYKAKYSRSFILPENIDTDAIKAEYRNGILTVTLPKKMVQQPLSKEIIIS